MDINWVVDAPFRTLPAGSGEKIAVSIDGDETFTYRQLRDRRNQFVGVLVRAGIKPGDRVGIIMHNSLDYVALYFAITRIGAIAARINFRLAPQEFTYIINDAGCSAVFFDSGRIPELESVHGAACVSHWFCMQTDGSPIPGWASDPFVGSETIDVSKLPRPRAEDHAMIMYTSGTTGRPKGAVWTHQNSLWAAASQALGWGYNSSTVSFSISPMHHVMGMEGMMLPALLVNGSMALLKTGAVTLERIISAVQKCRATHAWMPPFALTEIARRRDVDHDTMPTVKNFMSGGDAVHAWVLEEVQKKFPGVEVQQGYGLTEGGSIVTMLDPADAVSHFNSMGRPFPLMEAKVMRDEETEAAADEIGEIWVKSPAMSAGYWNMPEQSRKTFGGGYCRTGDLGHVTLDGYLMLDGRAKDMIRSGVENIYPAELEAVLTTYPGIAALAVIAVPDEKYREVGCAVVVPSDPGADTAKLEGGLRDFATSQFARYKCPKHYVFVDKMPINATGKIQKALLREAYAHLGSSSGIAPNS